MKRSYLTAKEAEQVMQETRNQDGFTGKNEKILVNTMVKNAKANNRIGDKLLMVIDPKYIHIPEWQRNIRLEKAYAIGNNYDKYKWDAPKILLFEDKYLCIDGQHRIFGAFKAKKEDVVCEVMECTIMSRFIQRLKDKGYKVTGDIVTLLGTEFKICSGYIETARGKQKSYWLELR